METSRLTAAIVFRVDQLYSASAQLKELAGYYRDDRHYARARRATDAASRLSLRAYILLYRQLSHVENSKLCQLNNDRRLREEAQRAHQPAKAA